MALPGTTLFSSVVITAAVRSGLRLASKRGWLPRVYYQRQVLSSLKEKDIDKALKNFRQLRRRGYDQRSEIVADLLRMVLDTELRTYRRKVEEIQARRSELSRELKRLQNQPGSPSRLRKALQLTPSVLAALGGIGLLTLSVEAASAATRVAAGASALLTFAYTGFHLRGYRRWLRKRRWLVESRGLRIQSIQRDLADLRGTEEGLLEKITRLEAQTVELLPAADSSETNAVTVRADEAEDKGQSICHLKQDEPVGQKRIARFMKRSGGSAVGVSWSGRS